MALKRASHSGNPPIKAMTGLTAKRVDSFGISPSESKVCSKVGSLKGGEFHDKEGQLDHIAEEFSFEGDFDDAEHSDPENTKLKPFKRNENGNQNNTVNETAHEILAQLKEPTATTGPTDNMKNIIGKGKQRIGGLLTAREGEEGGWGPASQTEVRKGKNLDLCTIGGSHQKDIEDPSHRKGLELQGVNLRMKS